MVMQTDVSGFGFGFGLGLGLGLEFLVKSISWAASRCTGGLEAQDAVGTCDKRSRQAWPSLLFAVVAYDDQKCHM